MFVRILTKTKNSSEEHCTGQDYLYECRRVSMRQDSSAESVMLIIDVGEQVERTFVVEKATSEVYYMNNEGKTIDKYAW